MFCTVKTKPASPNDTCPSTSSFLSSWAAAPRITLIADLGRRSGQSTLLFSQCGNREFRVRKTQGVSPPEQDIIATLDAALKRKDRRAFLTALKPMVIERGGFKAIARETTLNRTALYRLLSSDGDAKLSTLLALLPSLGMRLSLKRFRKTQGVSQKRGQAKTRIAKTVQSL